MSSEPAQSLNVTAPVRSVEDAEARCRCPRLKRARRVTALEPLLLPMGGGKRKCREAAGLARSALRSRQGDDAGRRNAIAARDDGVHYDDAEMDSGDGVESNVVKGYAAGERR